MAIALAYDLQSHAIEKRIARYFPPGRLNQIFRTLDGEREWAGAGVTFVPDIVGQIERSIAEGKYRSLGNRKSDIIEKLLRTSCRADGKTLYIREILPQPRMSRENVIERERSTLGKELIATGWSCTGAAIGWVLIIGEVGAGTVSVGTTWSAVPLTLAATSASTFQCGTAIGRSFNAAVGNGHYNDMLDDSIMYQALMTGLDVVQIADVAQTLGKQSQLYRVLSSKNVSSGGFLRVVKGLNRAERKRLAQELLKFENPRLAASKKLLKQALKNANSLSDESSVTKVYTQSQVQTLLKTKAVELIGAALTIKGSLPGAVEATEQAIGFVVGVGH